MNPLRYDDGRSTWADDDRSTQADDALGYAPGGAAPVTFAERTAALRDRVMEWWRRAQRHGLWFMIREHTSLVRDLADPDGGGPGMLACGLALPCAILLLVGMLAGGLMGQLMGAVAILGFLFGMGCLLLFWYSYRDSTQRTRDWFATRKGLMGMRMASERLGAHPLARDARHVMPAIARSVAHRYRDDPRTRDLELARHMGFRIGVCHGVTVWLPYETGGYELAPTRAGKTSSLVIPMIVEAPGPVVTTSSRVDSVEQTIRLRSQGWCTPEGMSQTGGPVWVFDPLGVASGRYDDHRLVWDPIAACADPRAARSAAEAMVSTVGIGGENEMWGRMAIDIVQALLLAAAVSGGTLADVYRWSQSVESLEEPKGILRVRAAELGNRASGAFTGRIAPGPAGDADDGVASDWLRALSSLEHEDGRIVGSKMLGVTGAFSALSIPAVRDYLSPRHDDPRLFDFDRFLQPADGVYGTVYFLSELRPVEGQRAASAAAFSSMFLNQLRDRARRIALSNEDQKLEHPVFLVLDEIDNIQPWQGLPQMYTAGQAELIVSHSFHQSRTGARAAFGSEEGQMWENAQLVMLGGVKDAQTRRDVSDLCGTVTGHRSSESTDASQGLLDALLGSRSTVSQHDEPVIGPDQLRVLPEGMALVVSRNNPPAIVELIPWWERGYTTLCEPDDIFEERP